MMAVEPGISPESDQLFGNRPPLEREALLRCDQDYRGLADRLARELPNAGRQRPIIGLQGCQGSGKSTLADYLCTIFEQVHGLRALLLSLDDFYLTRAERAVLARDVHPLLATRGVPGTHDIDLLLAVLAQLRDTGHEQGGELALPRFEKLQDDRADALYTVSLPVDLVILEGWCIGLPPQPDEALLQPVNDLERVQDADGRWRRYVNEQLDTRYRQLHQAIDHLVVLAPPGFDCVARWRYQQEQRLASMLDAGESMNQDAVNDFVQHFERLTRFALEVLPARADDVFRLDEQRHVVDHVLRAAVTADDGAVAS